MEAIFSQALPSASRSKRAFRISLALSGLGVAFLIFDATIKLVPIAPVVAAFQQLGYPIDLARSIGILELLLLALYCWPRASVFGALLWTGFLGGAISTHLRINDPLFSHTLFPLYVAALLWGGLYVRDPRVQALVPWRK